MVSALETNADCENPLKQMEVIQVQKNLYVDGLYCSSCDALVEEELSSVNGVHGVQANHATGKVSVLFDGGLATFNEVRLSILRLGFNVWMW
ncbi:heavy-metal-associated domain-containing protein [Candidatus Micrarchaeota archaeon]|nr:heavy-metal-associated domain-containing protein [Candidatus Micrarchaeota archaeon]